LDTNEWDIEWGEECGVFGVFGCKDAAKLCYLGLYALQHRGQESAGIVSYDSKHFYVVKEEGLVSDVFNSENLAYLKGKDAIGHVRYSTTGGNNINNIQPLYSKTVQGKIAIAHNGNLTNAYSLYKQLEAEGALFQTTVDSETILHLISRSGCKTIVESFQKTLAQLEGAYSLVSLGEDFMIAARDPSGFRPLVLGALEGGYVVASETCALDLIDATYIREVEPGEIIYITKSGIESYKIPKKVTPALCIFEHVYFSRPDSIVFGENVHLIRKAFGAQLSKEYPVEADIVIAIPDSGNSAALGYAEASGIPYEIGMTRNHYVGRTFIQPEQKIRDFAVKVKLNPIKEVLKGKRVVVVDDSLVRGTTSRRRVSAIRDSGALEVHLRISSPPIQFPCHFGIDTPQRSKLIAAQKKIKEIMDYVGADSLGYLSQKGMLDVMKNHRSSDFCTACFDGKYPVKVRNKGKGKFEGRRIKLYAAKH
jgi:amidophosphoribosyltransferase